jgi:hypothetical protein
MSNAIVQVMGMVTLRKVMFALALATTPAIAGCYGDAAYPVEAEGWTPQYYDGYMVYYDAGGRPFYYLNGASVWIPESSPYYARYNGYWRANSYAYSRWYGHYGAGYRTYRVAPGHYGGYYRRRR